MIDLFITSYGVKKLVPYHYWKFPGGEIGVKVEKHEINTLEPQYVIEVTGRHSFDDLMILAQMVDAVRPGDARVHVTMPYLPYARQDRRCHKGEGFALRSYIQFLKTIPFDTLFIQDVHSQVSVNLFGHDDRVVFIEQHNILDRLLAYGLECDVIVSPDDGAAAKLKDKIRGKVHMTLTKHRVDGKVVHDELTVDQFKMLKGRRVLIVDDICDGGATFLSVAKLFEASGCIKLDLFVTHGIFSAGIEKLKAAFDEIYCSNLMSDDEGVKNFVQIIE